MSNGVYLLLGTNLGDRKKNLEVARSKVHKTASVLRASDLYETKAWGLSDQPDFLNQVLLVSPSDGPQELLIRVLEIEQEMGRDRILKWGPRVIDIDILFYNDSIVKTPALIIPHPEMHRRRFTLLPLNEIASEFIHPVYQRSVRDLLTACDDPLEVKRFAEKL